VAETKEGMTGLSGLMQDMLQELAATQDDVRSVRTTVTTLTVFYVCRFRLHQAFSRRGWCFPSRVSPPAENAALVKNTGHVRALLQRASFVMFSS